MEQQRRRGSSTFRFEPSETVRKQWFGPVSVYVRTECAQLFRLMNGPVAMMVMVVTVRWKLFVDNWIGNGLG